MKTIFSITIMALTVYLAAARTPIHEVISQIEQNNVELEARRKLRDAQRADARVGNSLEDPEIEYIHQWGKRSEWGTTDELTVTQSFDFPTVYANRAKLSDLRSAVYGHEYEAYRQEILYEAHALCITVLSLRQKQSFLGRAMQDAERVARLVAIRAEAGDANALEENKARFEYITAANAYKLSEIELSEAMNRLATLNGGQQVLLEGPGLDPEVDLRPLAEMMEIYESLSPDLLAALASAQSAKRDITLSKSQSLPRFTLGYKYDYSSREKFNGVVAGITVPLFANRNNVKRARAQAAFADAEVARTRNDIRMELTGLYSRAELLRASSRQYEQILSYSDSSDLLSKALDQGHISLIDYYAQLQPIYDGYLTMIDVLTEYNLICARINAVFL